MRKRIVSIILITALVFGFVLPFSSSSAKADSDIIRYTVLVLDTSGSFNFLDSNGQVFYTADTATNYVKQASQKFLDDILNANGTNYVSVVEFKSTANVVSDFTDDSYFLKNKISNLSSGGYCNISSGLSKADELLSKTPNSTNVKKNVVLFTTGMTYDGEYNYSGKYNSSTVGSNWRRVDNQVRFYAYANNAISVADELKKQANIYTLGLFRTFDNMPDYGKDIVDFFKLTAKDLATSESYFYQVDDPNDIEFAFGDIADNIKNDYPIIIIPGVMGSNLYYDDDVFNSNTKVWAPSGNVFSQLWTVGYAYMLAMDSGYTMYTRPIENQNKKNITREYGAVETYKEVVDRVCREFPDREVYFFSYDFRQSNSITADKLSNFIFSNGINKVDLVCHSMGGLVASHYVSKYGSDKIGKIITCGTPYEGAPTLINTVLNWDILEEETAFNIGDNLLGSLGGLTKKVKASFPAVAELAPTENYLNYNNKQVWAKYSHTETQGFLGLGGRTKYYNQILYPTYRNICNNIFGDLYNSATINQQSINVDGYNILTTLDNTYFIVGINQKTVTSIWFNDGDSLNSLECDELKYETLGDGTVPYYSATVSNKLNSLKNKESRVFEYSTNHGGTIGHQSSENSNTVNRNAQKSLDTIIDILKNSISDNSSDKFENKPYIVVRIACPVEAEITYNNETLSSGLKVYQTTSFGRLDVISGNEDRIKMLCLDAQDSDYLIELFGTGSGVMNYQIEWYSSNGEILEMKEFSNISINENTKIFTSTNNELTQLNVDNDGDGDVDNVINPDSSTENCDCKCHRGGIAGFFFKIVLFFQKLFGNNLECICGAKH